MSLTVFTASLSGMIIVLVALHALHLVKRKPEVKPPFDPRPCHVKLWMVDNNTVEFDGPGTEMADLLAEATGEHAFVVDTKEARILINPRHVIQGRLEVKVEATP